MGNVHILDLGALKKCSLVYIKDITNILHPKYFKSFLINPS